MFNYIAFHSEDVQELRTQLIAAHTNGEYDQFDADALCIQKETSKDLRYIRASIKSLRSSLRFWIRHDNPERVGNLEFDIAATVEQVDGIEALRTEVREGRKAATKYLADLQKSNDRVWKRFQKSDDEADRLVEKHGREGALSVAEAIREGHETKDFFWADVISTITRGERITTKAVK